MALVWFDISDPADNHVFLCDWSKFISLFDTIHLDCVFKMSLSLYNAFKIKMFRFIYFDMFSSKVTEKLKIKDTVLSIEEYAYLIEQPNC